MTNYSTFLIDSRRSGIRSGILNSVAQGSFIFFIYLSYAYAFFMGGIWVEKKIWNTGMERAYTSGDSLACFFAVIIGFFSLGSTSNFYKNIIEGKVAGKMAFDIIDRVPTIDQDAEGNNKHDLKGEIEFRNVDFFYPTRPDV